MENVCFTGHRTVKNNHEIIKKLIRCIEELISDGAVNFYAGGALGFDTICSITILNMKNVYPEIKLHLVLPCLNEYQTKGWTDEQKNIFRKILSCADSVEYVSEEPEKDCMKKRNARLVELADVCICYYNGKRYSGTAQTMRMAYEKGIEVRNIIF